MCHNVISKFEIYQHLDTIINFTISFLAIVFQSPSLSIFSIIGRETEEQACNNIIVVAEEDQRLNSFLLKLNI